MKGIYLCSSLMDLLNTYGLDIKSNVSFERIKEVIGEAELSLSVDQTAVLLQATQKLLGDGLEPFMAGNKATSQTEYIERLDAMGIDPDENYLNSNLNAGATSDGVIVLYEDSSCVEQNISLPERILLALKPVKTTSEILDSSLWKVYSKIYA